MAPRPLLLLLLLLPALCSALVARGALNGVRRPARFSPPAMFFEGLAADLSQQADVYKEALLAAAPSMVMAAWDGAPAQITGALSSPTLAVAAFFVPGLSIALTGRSITAADRGHYSGAVPYREGKYDPAAADRFFAYRPWLPMTRFFQLTQLTGGFVTHVLLDKWAGREDDEATVEKRSEELLHIVSKLGPTAIKVGQALSIRQDLLPAPYIRGLVQLQDNVPPFSAEIGRAVIAQELGLRDATELGTIFSELSPKPVASASVGQVYRGVLRDGRNVAVKVQRPKVLLSVSLDLYMMRLLAPTWQRVNNLNTDLVALVDEWGRGFVNELDYRREAASTTAFAGAMRARGLDAVTAPAVVDELSTSYVLTTEWVEGERLADSSAGDVARLCGVALNAYLTMLLDTGVLHCDPHPGNLLRTLDGKLCILDWGMVLEVPSELQYSLLEFIAHLSAEDYEAVPDDLVKLGFIPSRYGAEQLRASGVTTAISFMLRQAAQGGGPKGIQKRIVQEAREKYGKDISDAELREKLREEMRSNMAADASARASSSTTADVTSKLDALQREQPNYFQVPSYFVYTSRAFSTLEGIGLACDEDYAILSECYPYLAKRLLSDDSPRAREALRTLLFSAKSGVAQGGRGALDVSRLSSMAEGLQSYTTSTASAQASAAAAAASEELLSLLLSEDGSFAQELLLTEAAASLDAFTRVALTEGPARALITSAPVPAPISMLGEALLAPDEHDRKRAEALRLLVEMARSRLSAPGSQHNDITNAVASNEGSDANGRQSSAMVPLLPAVNLPSTQDLTRARDTLVPLVNRAPELAQKVNERRTAIARTATRFAGAIANAQADRLRGRVDRAESLLARRVGTAGILGLEVVGGAFAALDRGLAAAAKLDGESHAAPAAKSQR